MRQRVTWVVIAALIVAVSLPVVSPLVPIVLLDGGQLESPTPQRALSEPDISVSAPSVSLLAPLFFRGPPAATLSV